MIAGSDLIDSMPRLLIQILLDHGQRVWISRATALAWRLDVFPRIETNQRALPIETNVSLHKGWKCQRSVCFIQAGNSTGSHDCRVFRGNRGLVREIPELPTTKNVQTPVGRQPLPSWHGSRFRS